VRWHEYELPAFRAGAADWTRVDLENAGSAAWRAQGDKGVFLAYHWLDPLGNAIVWAPQFIALPWPVPPGHRFEVAFPLRAPIPPGRYRLAIDLLDEGRSWFSELGNTRLEVEADVRSRLTRRALAVQVAEGPAELVEATRAALAALEEPVVEAGEAVAFLSPGCRPAPDWSRRVLDLHEEGYAAIGGSISVEGSRRERRQLAAELEPWRPGFGRVPGWSLPLLCPSVVSELVGDVPWADPLAGLPTLDAKQLEDPWLCDGRLRVEVPARALRPGDRPRA
jgi:hypothetical protein